MAEKYLAKFERQWEQNRKSLLGSKLQMPSTLDPRLERAKSLRGPDFVTELIRLAVLTGDTRFQDAAFALFEHGIVGDKFKFLRWERPWVAKEKKQVELMVLICLCWTKSRGVPLRRSCAKLAALLGWPATSFAAAMKDLELIYRTHLAGDWRYSPDEFRLMNDLLEKLAATEKQPRSTEVGISV
jgi:hypothetical protein